MVNVLAINGSPRKSAGNTAFVLAPFLEGVSEMGAEVELIYASKLKLKPCSCGTMHCWYNSPGVCCIDDEMGQIYPKLKEADILILATPVYIPLPGAMQNVLNRLCPLVEPDLEFREARTRAHFREDVKIKKIILVSTGGWWEKENMGTVVRIVKELAEDASVEFGGAILRPHAFMMKQNGQLTEDGKDIIEELRVIGKELIQTGEMDPGSIKNIGRPLVSEEDLRQWYNQAI
ncbi:MAG: NAD(P)H-dependent oxidoreductase [Anaerolineales bacterium]